MNFTWWTSDMNNRSIPIAWCLPLAPREALLAGSFTHERNFFNISYGIYINFVNRSKLILKEMWLILILDIFTLLLVFTVFYPDPEKHAFAKTSVGDENRFH